MTEDIEIAFLGQVVMGRMAQLAHTAGGKLCVALKDSSSLGDFFHDPESERLLPST